MKRQPGQEEGNILKHPNTLITIYYIAKMIPVYQESINKKQV